MVLHRRNKFDNIIYGCNPQNSISLCGTCRLSLKVWKSVQRFDLGAWSRKKTGQSKKSQRRYISPIWGEAPTELIFTEICIVVGIPDMIMCANFWTEIFRGYNFTGGKFPVYLLILAWALQQYSANAPRVIESVTDFCSSRYMMFNILLSTF